MDKKPIIFVCQRIPYPPDRGDRIVTWHLVLHLSQRYDTHLFCLTQNPDELNKKNMLSNYCKSVNIFYKPGWRSRLDVIIKLFFPRVSLSCAYYRLNEMKREIERTVKREGIALAIVFSSNMFGYIHDVGGIKKILYMTDVDSEKWKKLSKSGPLLMRPIYHIEQSRLRNWELECDRSADYLVLCADEEVGLLRSLGAKGKIAVVKNSVDADYFKPDKDIDKERAVVFIGVMDYFPNIDAVSYFLKEVLPLIRKEEPETRFYVVGPNPPTSIKRLVYLAKNCVVTGYVDDVRPFMNRSRAFIAPMRIAQGVQTKVLQALSMELPVVATSKIATVLQMGESEGIISADTPSQISEAVLHLLRNPQLSQKFGERGRRTVLEICSWDKELQKLNAILDSL